MLQETYQLQKQERYQEALKKLDEIEALAPGLADVYNMRGSLYLTPALRDFDKAAQQLDKAAAIQPSALAPRFNKAELLFVKKDWPAASAALQKLLDDLPDLQLQVRHLTLFKRLICEVQMDQYEQAEKTLKDHFTFMDDTPAYYYSKAAIASGRNEETTSREWIAKAAKIYKPGQSAAYMDALVESELLPGTNSPPPEKK